MKTITKYAMATSHTSFVLGLSGGADSVSLLHFLRKTYPCSLIVCVHVNHGLRGADADADADACREFCKKLDVPLIEYKEDVAAIAKRDGISIEEAGRNLRYSCFEQTRMQFGYEKIAVAHNRNDVVETALMQAFRGAGALRGIRPVNGHVIRPLIDIERAEIEAYCRENALEYCTDATNLDNAHTRNRIRNKLLPIITQEFGPSAYAALARMVEVSAAENAFLDNIAKNSYDICAIHVQNYAQEELSLDIEALLQHDIAIRRRIVRIGLATVYGSSTNISFAHVDAILDLCGNISGSMVTLPQNFVAERVYENICIRKRRASEAFFVNLSKGEAVYVPSYRKYIGLYDCVTKENAFTMLLDCDIIEKMQVRSRLPGDTIRFDAVGTKKIKDYFIDKKIPRHQRKTAVFVACGSDIVLILDGLVKSDKFKPVGNSCPLYLQVWDA